MNVDVAGVVEGGQDLVRQEKHFYKLYFINSQCFADCSCRLLLPNEILQSRIPGLSCLTEDDQTGKDRSPMLMFPCNVIFPRIVVFSDGRGQAQSFPYTQSQRQLRYRNLILLHRFIQHIQHATLEIGFLPSLPPHFDPRSSDPKPEQYGALRGISHRL